MWKTQKHEDQVSQISVSVAYYIAKQQVYCDALLMTHEMWSLVIKYFW